MPQTVNLNTITNTTVNNGDIQIFTFYDEGIQVSSVFVSENSGSFSGASYVEGELVVSFVNSNPLTLENDGTLTVSSLNEEKYSIDSDGNLIYTE